MKEIAAYKKLSAKKFRTIVPQMFQYGYLSHPNLVKEKHLTNFNQSNDHENLQMAGLFLETKYLKTNDMKHVTSKKVKKMMIKSLGNLYLIHSSGVVHCDIHSLNVVYNEEQNAFYYIDFGSSSINNDRNLENQQNHKQAKSDDKQLDEFLFYCWLDYLSLIDLLCDCTNYIDIDCEFVENQKKVITEIANKYYNIEKELKPPKPTIVKKEQKRKRHNMDQLDRKQLKQA
ncbi:uncharacterized protein ASCRUDRAFT_71194 [Ascoidea rubescens DSM 1968]|uniref:Protein kinase domain-containing protein n=1 Tax=Ascoidea rubescens DSM 1968 TaxID=1344418 RepID=A0A1D2VF62_9ASCO|nr:hypothetical protein ASCRUDRAFT_71194 [Ascoidea rubescens DSM 1968]ODV60160.1 hypothetical protein ASCRUDRAFT_71194 [Ascoidea rubescens DSM 1968]